jgi:hypothetical protein
VVAGGLEVVLDDSWAATRARTEERAMRESFILMRQKRQTLVLVRLRVGKERG